jgi:hypothetical protein
MDDSHADGYPCNYYEKNVKCNLVIVLTDPVIVRNNSGSIYAIRKPWFQYQKKRCHGPSDDHRGPRREENI